MGFVIVDVIIAFVYRIEQKVKCRIQILPVELAQHFTAVIMKLAVCGLDGQGPVHTVLCLVREVFRIYIFFIQDVLDLHVLRGVDTKTAGIQ